MKKQEILKEIMDAFGMSAGASMIMAMQAQNAASKIHEKLESKNESLSLVSDLLDLAKEVSEWKEDYFSTLLKIRAKQILKSYNR